MYRLSRCVPLTHEDKTFQDAHQHADTNNPKKPIMKFMSIWQFHQGKLHEGYSHFFKMTPEQDAADRGSRIKLLEQPPRHPSGPTRLCRISLINAAIPIRSYTESPVSVVEAGLA
jgi:hypothetical protein